MLAPGLRERLGTEVHPGEGARVLLGPGERDVHGVGRAGADDALLLRDGRLRRGRPPGGRRRGGPREGAAGGENRRENQADRARHPGSTPGARPRFRFAVRSRAMSPPEFELRFAPVAGDIDELGHVSNLVWLGYVLTAARAHSSAVGLDHAAYLALGAVFVVRRHEIDYLAPAFEGEPLVTRTFVASWGAAVSERRTRIVRASDEREVLRAVTTWAFVSLPSGRPRRIPKEVVDAFAKAPRG